MVVIRSLGVSDNVADNNFGNGKPLPALHQFLDYCSAPKILTDGPDARKGIIGSG